MAKKKGLAATQKRRRARRKPSPVANPPIVKDLTGFILPGFGAYAATRLLSRMIYAIVQRKWPKFGKHAAALGALGTFGGSWMLAHRIKKLEPYHDAIVIGSGIATLQTLVRTYVPKYGWIVSDYRPEDLGPVKKPAELATRASQVQAAAGEFAGDEFSYLEAELEAVEDYSPPTTAAAYDDSDDDEITEDDLAAVLGDDEDAGDLYQGSFAN